MEDTVLISILSKLDNISVEPANLGQLEEIFNELKTVNEKLMLVNNNMAGIYDVMEEAGV
jgi:gamma-glutamylcysteine synthetase